jgi:16S rRNA (guanine527-N7)-methyltransferase
VKHPKPRRSSSSSRVSRETGEIRKPTRAPHAASSANPEKIDENIACDVRERVARWLDQTTLHPRDGFLERTEKMAATLALWGAHTNLTADASDPAEIAFHIADSLAPIAFAPNANRQALEAALAEGANALDLGSGAGFPGLVLAAAFDARFTLAEARRKRASYLQVAAHGMGLRNVAIEQGRATVRSIANRFDLVTARAFGTSAELYEIAAAALRPGGILLQYASAEQTPVDEPRARARFAAHFIERLTWTYRLPHGERVATRTAVLWRKPRIVPTDL